MTAIMRFYGEDGFVLAADGLVRRSTDLTPLDLHRQKIFALATTVAFSAAGAVQLGPPGDEFYTVFDFIEEVKNASSSVAFSRAQDLTWYATKIATRVNQRLRDLSSSGLVDLPFDTDDHPEHGHFIVGIFFDGFVRGAPSSVHVRFYHRVKTIGEPIVETHNLDLPIWLHGSDTVAELLRTNDPRFQKYRTPLPHSLGSDLLNRQAWFSSAYVRACSGPEAREIDVVCEGIGGHAHMATITSERGFQWVPGFQPFGEEPA